MSLKTFITSLSLFLLPFRVYAHEPAEGKIWATTGPYLYRTLSSHQEHNDPLYGAALLVEGDVDKNGGVEIAAFYLDKLYFREKKHAVMIEKIKRMYITTGYRHWFVPWLSAGAAFFSSYSMGDARIIQSDLPRDEEPDTSARDITEYGFDFSLQWEMWGTEHVAVVSDARYSLSMTKKSREDADVYGLVLGIKYLIPKKE